MKLYRKLAALGLAAAMAVGMAVTASAASPVTVTVNGTDVTASAYINDDWRTMVSTDIADDLGLTATVSGDSVTFTDGTTSQTYTVGAAVEDTAVELVDGAIYVPFAPLAQAFGYTVGWDGAAGVASGKPVAPHHRLHPEAGAAHQNGQLAPGEDVIHDGDGRLGVPGGGPLLRGVRHADHVVGDALHLLRRGGGGADHHAPVDLHGVGGDHFPMKPLGQQHPQRGLSAGGGAHHTDDLRRHGRILLPVFHAQHASAARRATSSQAETTSSSVLAGSRSSPPPNT